MNRAWGVEGSAGGVGQPPHLVPMDSRCRRELSFEVRMGVHSAELKDTSHA